MSGLGKAIVRWFGFCGHEWDWNPELFDDSHSLVYTQYQRAICERCGMIKQRSVGRRVATKQKAQPKVRAS